jgi:EamA domain-containing membrane protein RarD
VVDPTIEYLINRILLVVIAGIIGVMLIYRLGWIAAALSIAWGVWGIYNKQVAMNRAETYQLICLIVIGLVVLNAIVQQIINKRKSTL